MCEALQRLLFSDVLVQQVCPCSECRFPSVSACCLDAKHRATKAMKDHSPLQMQAKYGGTCKLQRWSLHVCSQDKQYRHCPNCSRPVCSTAYDQVAITLTTWSQPADKTRGLLAAAAAIDISRVDHPRHTQRCKCFQSLSQDLSAGWSEHSSAVLVRWHCGRELPDAYL